VTGSAAGRVLLAGQDKGSGFAITEGRALTAGHVVRAAVTLADGQQDPAAGPPGPALVYLVDRGEPAAVPAVVAYQPEGGEPIPVTRIEVSTSLDVAVLHLQHSAPAVLPAAGSAAAGAPWRVETRPGRRDPTLTGTVDDPHRRMWNDAEKETTLIQLRVDQQVGGYHGYSGSPVITAAADGTTGGVLGVLVEQGRWRVSPQLGQPPPVANVLFAAPIAQVLTEFGLTGVAQARPARDIPLPVSFEVRRTELLSQVLGALTGPSPEGRLVGLAGMGGAGKSVLAAATARDPKMVEAFPDGRFWLELGPNPPLPQLQASLAAALGDSTPVTDVPQGRALLSRLLAERRCLLVLDNVQDQPHLAAFNVVGPAGQVLATAREADTLPGATIIPLGELAAPAAMQLLAGWAGTRPDDLPAEAAQVAAECGYLPLALASCGAMISDGSHTWAQLLDLLREADLDEFHSRLIDYPHPSLAVALGASLSTLDPATRDRYQQLAVFEGQGPIPSAAVQALWGLDQQHTTALIGDLAGKSLLHVEAGRVSLHDLQMDYLTRLTPDRPALHNQLITAYRDQCPGGWATGPDDGYFYQHLAHHLHKAARAQELQALLLDLDWMHAKLTTDTMPGLLADYDTLPTDPALRLVADALQLSAHVLAGDPGQLPSQLTGRLTGQTDPHLRDLLQRIRQWPAPWLRPLTASLTPPGGPLRRTLAAGTSADTVAVSADGRRAVSDGRTGWDGRGGKMEVWDLETGMLLHTLTGHDGHGNLSHAVAVTADGTTAVSAGGQDMTVRVWDLETGTLLRTLTGHDDWVTKVAVSADGRRAVSGGEDKTVRVWDLETGTLLHTLTGHTWPVQSVAVSADGRRGISGSQDGPVRVWDLETGTLQHILTGHGHWVVSVAVSADGRRGFSGSQEGTVRVWDLDAGELLHTLTGQGKVATVAISADGRRGISSGEGGAVRVWDLDTGTLLRTLTGHDGFVEAVVVSAGGRRAVSGGADGTVRVWDLDTGTLLYTLTGHDAAVTAVAVSADGRRAVSSGIDKTVRVWDIATGKQIVPTSQVSMLWLLRRRLQRHGRARSLAVSADGRRAVSGHDDSTVRVWDLESGELRHTLKGLRLGVYFLAISADGRRAVCSGGFDGTAVVWDLDAGILLHTLTGHDRWVPVAVSADGRRAITGGNEGTVRMWDLTQGAEIASFASGDSIAVIAATPAGARVVVGTSVGPVHLLELCGHEYPSAPDG
jgi:WD40 repeat protein